MQMENYMLSEKETNSAFVVLKRGRGRSAAYLEVYGGMPEKYHNKESVALIHAGKAQTDFFSEK